MAKWLNIGFYFAMALFVVDIVAIYGAIKIVHSYRLEWLDRIDLLPILAVMLMTILLLYIMNVYQFYRRRTAVNMATRTFVAVGIAGLVMSSFLYATKSTDITTVFWRGNLPIAMIIFAFWASIVRYIATLAYERVVSNHNWLAVGSDSETKLLQQEYFDSMSTGNMQAINVQEFNKLLAQPTSEKQVKGSTGIVIVSHVGLSNEAVQSLMQVRLHGTAILGLADFYEQYLLKIPVQQLKDSWFVYSGGFNLIHHDIALKIKRIADIILAAIGLLISMPIMLLVSVVVALSSTGPVFYSQERFGQFRKVIQLRKFRTMIHNAENNGAQWSQPNDPRVTFVGKFLRSSRLDELPQLWNVLIGDMSFIGPRPERQDFVIELERQIPYYDLRHLVKPGITGWAQVMYPYGRSVEDALRKLEYDLYYIKNYSLTMDVYILLRTVRTVFSRAGY